MPTIKIVSVDEAEIDAAGKEVSVFFRSAMADRLEVSFEVTDLAAMIGQLSGVVAEAQKIRAVTAGQPTILQARRADGFRANPSLESHQIILTLQTTDGFEHNFSIASEFAGLVCTEIQKAAQKSEKSLPPTKQ